MSKQSWDSQMIDGVFPTKSTMICGQVRLLPWWQLQQMSDDDIKEFNRKHLVEVEMLDNFDRAKVGYDRMDAHDKDVWNAAIEAAAISMDEENFHVSAAIIRKLKK